MFVLLKADVFIYSETCIIMRPGKGSFTKNTKMSLVAWYGLYKSMFILPVMRDHLSWDWETTKFNGSFIQVSLFLNFLPVKWFRWKWPAQGNDGAEEQESCQTKIRCCAHCVSSPRKAHNCLKACWEAPEKSRNSEEAWFGKFQSYCKYYCYFFPVSWSTLDSGNVWLLKSSMPFPESMLNKQ